jgi:hypothetical protein
MKDEIKFTVKQFRNFRIEFESDFYNGQKLDTKVKIFPNRITDETMFVIAGNDIEKFSEEFGNLITKYKI